jgi:hypothetical protein
MTIIKSVVDFFRGSNGESQKIDRWGIMNPITIAGDYITATKTLYGIILRSPNTVALIAGKMEAQTKYEEKAQEAYKTYLSALPAHDRSTEINNPMSTIILAIEYSAANIALIEDNFEALFGGVVDGDENSIKSSSLIVLGYIEMVNDFMNWLSHLSAHAVDDTDLIPPYWSNKLSTNAKAMGNFVGNTLNKWNPKHKGLLETIRRVQKMGSDVTVKTGDHWMDDIVSDNQFSPDQQDLMRASIRNPVLWWIDNRIVSHQHKIELYSSRKDWLIAKVALEERRLAGIDQESLEYKKLKKVVDNYASIVTRYEQKLERLRA